MDDLEKHIKIIQEAINNERNLAVFVGAGVSKNSEVPTWGELIKIFIKKLKVNPSDISSDYLKIAQYYYNTDPISYKKILDKNLNRNWETNSISKFIFEKLNPKYIITTNYDCILEDTAKELNITDYKIVCKNEDIPSIKDRVIIKMHGDFENNNIVFKENDYTKYSEKFKLVETYIKSIFATSVVLFIGFSAEDPNVNQIYQWVKDILKKNKQPSYMILCDKKTKREYDIQKKYLENKDIYTINYYEIEDKIKDFCKNYSINNNELKVIRKRKGRQLYKILNFLRYYNENTIQNIEQRIEIMNTFNYMDIEDKIEFLFGVKFVRYIPNEQKIELFDSKLKRFMQKLHKSKNNIALNKIKKYLIINNIKYIEYNISNKTLEVNVEQI